MFDVTGAEQQDLSVTFSGPRRSSTLPLADGPDVFAHRSPLGRRDPMSAYELDRRGTRLDLGA